MDSFLKMNAFLIVNVIIVVHLIGFAVGIGPLGAFGVGVGTAKCEPSLTTASGPYAVHKGDKLTFSMEMF